LNSAYAIAPVVGLLSAVHCIGMCGGIVGALSFSVPDAERRRGARLLGFMMAYNAGRVLSYAVAGALFGGLGALAVAAGETIWVTRVLRGIAALVTVGIGFYIIGWFPRFAVVERIGEPFWRLLEPLVRRLLPVRTLGRAFLFGTVWGWLPCGLVYAMLISTPAQADVVSGAVYMALFGLGTLPAMAGAGLLSARVMTLSGGRGSGLAKRRLQFAGGAAVVLLGLFPLLNQGI
jgi:sulfite exporter TauE/SafE